jgi:hypothetical protein
MEEFARQQGREHTSYSLEEWMDLWQRAKVAGRAQMEQRTQ